MEKRNLMNGLEIPLIGLGAKGIWKENGQYNSKLVNEQYRIYEYAVKSHRCSLFDTSAAYGLNERILGEVLEYCNKREDVMIMSKVSNRAQERGDIRAALEKSLDALHTDYIDVYLLHWPYTDYYIETWKQLEKIYEEGLVRAIGVCNCHIHHLNSLIEQCNIIPMVNEIEIHPLFTQQEIISYCKERDIQPIAYTPIARMHDVLINSKPIQELSHKYHKTPAQVILRWHYQKGYVAIPSTLSRSHFDEMFEVEAFSISDEEIAWIDSLNDNVRLRYNPDKCDFSRL